ncbi:hypothetical protein [Magnetospirillum moscoviense]|uniref:Uncharacterized protein n=1 Tax=Magnetospirillum moscoviense TaxID=1437059 RepID=A0A178MYB8_9PROT|nr:hypothetical protein [Magnetospirillum moscoviense]OAN55027.1 hypothetical protein A6A05_00260 [Magnetospirillum moscoviense]
MPVLLHHTGDIPPSGWDEWCAVAGCNADLPGGKPTARALAEAYDAVLPEWWRLAAELGRQPSAILSHACTAGGNVSDLGLMLAWSRLVGGWAAGGDRVLCLCDDPWLFRHLATLPGVTAGAAPSLAGTALRLGLRGWLARARVAVRMARAAWRGRGAACAVPPGRPAMLVYGHPASRPDGFDAYFGQLAEIVPEVQRILHVDCPPSRAAELGVGLHGWGSMAAALALVFRRWRPQVSGPLTWLVRRAAAHEGATGTPAMIAWQIHCQRRFLAAARPVLVAWPWENHAWERAFVRHARAGAIRTLGYQHATIGSLESNYAIHSLPDGVAALPDSIACAGPASRDRLVDWGVPADRLWIGGAWRFPTPTPLPWAADGAIFLPLPAQIGVARQMLAAARAATAHGWRFLVREHPMTSVGFHPEPGLDRSPGPLSRSGPLRVVLFAGSSVGLEALLAGLPAIRFLPQGLLANDILPPGLAVPAATADELPDRLAACARPEPLDAAGIFAEIDRAQWRCRVGEPS